MARVTVHCGCSCSKVWHTQGGGAQGGGTGQLLCSAGSEGPCCLRCRGRVEGQSLQDMTLTRQLTLPGNIKALPNGSRVIGLGPADAKEEHEARASEPYTPISGNVVST